MCEILTIQGNSQNIHFGKNEIKEARENNPDGAGYVIFDRDGKGGYAINDFATFGICETGWRYYAYDDIFCRFGDTFDSKKDKKNKKDEAVKAIFEKQCQLKCDQFMICHFRLATSGYGGENTQPILKTDYLVIHNGIFSFYNIPKKMSDTKFFADKMEQMARKIGIGEKDTKKENKLIGKMLKYAGGSYSMFIYSHITKRLYYVKNNSTSFFWSFDDILGSTREDRFPRFVKKAVENKLFIM